MSINTLQRPVAVQRSAKSIVSVKTTRILRRELTPFEHLVALHICDGLSNAAIARATLQPVKTIENNVSRMARQFGIASDSDTNVRVLLSLIYRSYFGDRAFEKMEPVCPHAKEMSHEEVCCLKSKVS